MLPEKKKKQIETLMTPEKAKEIRANIGVWLDENREKFVNQFWQALWQGVGKLDDEHAKIVYEGLGNGVCMDVYIPMVTQVMGMQFTPEELAEIDFDTALLIYKATQYILSEGNSTVTVQDGVVDDRTCYACSGGCGCVFDTHYKMFDKRNANKCGNCSEPSFKAWIEILMGKKLEAFEELEAFNRGGKACHWRWKIKDDAE
jgi:hypothetical protein